jgi:hypothetical protein
MATYIKASTFYIEGILTSLNAIKRKSFFNSTAVVDAIVLDIAVTNMIEWAAIVGSQEPQIARKILISFQSTMTEEELLKDAYIKWGKNCPSNADPIQAIRPPVFSKRQDVVEISLYQAFDVQVMLAGCCMEGLLWGMKYPEAVESYLKGKEQNRAPLSIYQKIDSEITRIPSYFEIISESKQIAEKYLNTVPSNN